MPVSYADAPSSGWTTLAKWRFLPLLRYGAFESNC